MYYCTIIKGQCTSSSINRSVAKSLAQARDCEVTFRTLHVIAHFGTALRPMFSLFMPVGHIATVLDLDNAAETMELRKHRAHAPLLLAENLGRGQSAINTGQSSI